MNKLIFDDHGLRSGWRAALFLFSFTFLSGIFIFAATPILSVWPADSSPGGYIWLVIPFGISAIVAIILGWLFGRLFERLPFAALGCSFRNKWLSHFALGSLVGSIAFVSAAVIAIVSGSMNFTFNHESSASSIFSSLAITFLIFAIGALSEETLFRGYPLQTLARSGHTWIGIVVTSLLFSLAHNNNPEVNPLALFNTFIAGIWFAAAYLKTRDLWFPLGVHLMWNWLQGPIFGITVSGISDLNPNPILYATDIGPAWMTGGSYGIEGGFACTVSILMSTVVIYLLPIRSATDSTDKTDTE